MGEAKTTRLPAALRREQLLDVAGRIVVEHGVAALTMEAVAARAGVSKGLGYAYFRNADDLLVALYERECDLVLCAVRAAMGGADTVEGRLRAAISAYFDHIEQRGSLFNILQVRARDQGYVATNSRRIAELAHEWADVIRADKDVPRRRAVLLAGFVVNLVAFSTAALQRDRSLGRAEVEDLVVGFTLAGLDATATRRRRSRLAAARA